MSPSFRYQRPMRHFPTAPIAVAAALLLGGCAGVGATSEPSRQLKIATWNLEHLAQSDGEGCRPRTEADYAVLRHSADQLDADIVAIQEVQNRAAAERVFDPAEYEVVMSSRPPSERGGACRGVPGQQIQNQAVGFAIRKGLRWTRNPDVSALGLGNPDLRWGVDVTIHGTRPLRLLAVHLKSGCNSGRAPTDPDCPVLFDQLPVLEDWTEARAAHGEAFIVLGDWNRRLTSHADAFFADLNDGDPDASRLTLASGDRPAGCKARYREFIDHIAVSASASGLTQPGSFEEFTYDLPEADHPSDHCPISIRVTS